MYVCLYGEGVVKKVRMGSGWMHACREGGCEEGLRVFVFNSAGPPPGGGGRCGKITQYNTRASPADLSFSRVMQRSRHGAEWQRDARRETQRCTAAGMQAPALPGTQPDIQPPPSRP